MNSAYCDKYKPKKIADIIGNQYSVNFLVNSLKKFQKLKKKCFLVIGNHGTGKTCITETILKELDYQIEYLHIKNLKTTTQLENYLNEITGCQNIIEIFQNIKKKKKAIIIDDLENDLMGHEKNQYVSLMKINNKKNYCPIIYIFNKTHNKYINELRKGSIEIKIENPKYEDMLSLITKICYYENVKIQNRNIANEIIKFSQNDYRRLCIILFDIINNLENHKIITMQTINKYQKSMLQKNVTLDLFESTKKLLYQYENINKCLQIYELEKVKIPAMIHQNYYGTISFVDGIFNQNNKNDLVKMAKISDYLSFGDIVDNFKYGEQRWDISNIHGFYSCCLPSYTLKDVKTNPYYKLKFLVDMNKTSIKKSNKKNIINISKNFGTLNPIDYINLGRLIKKNVKIDNLKMIMNIMDNYKVSSEKLESIIKIDKTNKYKSNLTIKQKKNLSSKIF